MDLERPLPNPITPEAKPYWDGLREQKLMLPKCKRLRQRLLVSARAVPVLRTPRDIAWVQASGRGKLYSFEIAHQIVQQGVQGEAPYVLAMVELEEGPRHAVEPDQHRGRSQEASAATCRWRSSSRSSPTRSRCRCSSRREARR